MVDFFFFIVAIVALLVVGTVANSWVHNRHRAGAAPDGNGTVPREEHDRLGGKVARLEARLATLERIATDQPNRLSAEIEHLR